jgi:hypothetical protein
MPALALDAIAAVKAYATWGGVPRYWELAAEYGSQEEALEDLAWNRRGVLHEEPARLLLDDLRSASWVSRAARCRRATTARPAEVPCIA